MFSLLFSVLQLLKFIRQLKLHEERANRRVLTVRFDRVPNLDASSALSAAYFRSLRHELESELGILTEYAPREHHEGVGQAEVHHDVLTRMAEAAMRRSQRGLAYMIPARSYMVTHLNLRPVSPNKISRHDHHSVQYLR